MYIQGTQIGCIYDFKKQSDSNSNDIGTSFTETSSFRLIWYRGADVLIRQN